MSLKGVIDWINGDGKPLWWRHAVRIAIGHGYISDTHMHVLLELAKMEFGLTQHDDMFSVNTSVVSDIGFTVESDPVRLAGISNVSNVAALVENQELTFNHLTNLTVVYGHNGSGKSSYAKILKNTCLTRGTAPDIISNVYSADNRLPQAEISVQIGNNPVQKEIWSKGVTPSSELKSIRVFDSSSAVHYLSKEDNIEYKPAALKVLDELIGACYFVGVASGNMINDLGHKATFPNFPFNSAAGIFIQGINRNTTSEQLERNCVTNYELDSLEQLRKDLGELKANPPQSLRKKFREKYQRIEPLIKHFDDLIKVLGNSGVSNISKIYDSVLKTAATAETSRRIVLGGLPIDGVASPAWITMWEHVENFIKTNGENRSFPPQEGDICPTCIQPITKSSAEKLQEFNCYLKDKTQSDANDAKKKFSKSVNTLQNLNIDLSAHDGVLKWIEEYKFDLAENIRKLNSDLLYRCNTILSDTPLFDFYELDQRGFEWLNNQSLSFKQKELEVKDDASKLALISKQETTIENIGHRVQVCDNKELIKGEVLRLKKSHLITSLKSSCKIASITLKVKEVAREGSVGELGDAFIQELKRLKFENLDVQTFTRGKDGQSTLQLKLSNHKAKISDIASEGEQKCIALAGFLAELIVDNRKSAIVFDDPVNSLDHLWRERFANRIVEESRDRQVVILTHDLPFLKLLEFTAQKYQTTIDVCAIRRYGNQSGLPMEAPPWEALKTARRIGKLKGKLPQLEKLFNNPDPDDFINAVQAFYCQMRITWERLIEEWLFKGVVERFSVEIKTRNLRYIDTIDQNDNKIISDSMGRCSEFMHYGAPEYGGNSITYEDVNLDFNNLNVYFNELKGRRT